MIWERIGNWGGWPVTHIAVDYANNRNWAKILWLFKIDLGEHVEGDKVLYPWWIEACFWVQDFIYCRSWERRERTILGFRGINYAGRWYWRWWR